MILIFLIIILPGKHKPALSSCLGTGEMGRKIIEKQGYLPKNQAIHVALPIRFLCHRKNWELASGQETPLPGRGRGITPWNVPVPCMLMHKYEP